MSSQKQKINKVSQAPLSGGILTIDLDALAHNYRVLQARAKPAKVAGVVKADAYGLGIGHVAPVLYKQGCRTFFVAHLQEAITLKNIVSSDATIAILNGVLPGAEKIAAENGFLPALNSLDSVERWADLCRQDQSKYPAMIQVDTGMARLGLDAKEVESLQKNQDIFTLADIRYILSHLACGDEVNNGANSAQLTALKNIISTLPSCKVSFANSGGIYQGPEFLFDLSRPGIALYGVDPFGNLNTDIKPVVKLEARIIQSRHVEKGTPVGYGGTFITQRPSVVTTIAVGYADGWHRSLSNKGTVFIQGHKVPIIGRVSMDSITLDTTDLPGMTPKADELVELIGPHQSLETVANDAGTIPYEILTSLGNRYERHYLSTS